MDAKFLMRVFSGLPALVMEDLMDGGDAVVVTARTRDAAVSCAACRRPTANCMGITTGH
ncbi:hypothetical protein [Streptomyces hokutonensis]|uniref:hypothetical protein n=1 Tax=Streptomyces hokutonensis TaxID=1306990 RepID=UPI00036DE01A|nr:hypothetical protein [Streptomyces hokutonensis]